MLKCTLECLSRLEMQRKVEVVQARNGPRPRLRVREPGEGSSKSKSSRHLKSTMVSALRHRSCTFQSRGRLLGSCRLRSELSPLSKLRRPISNRASSKSPRAHVYLERCQMKHQSRARPCATPSPYSKLSSEVRLLMSYGVCVPGFSWT